jgi:hypothetical protein
MVIRWNEYGVIIICFKNDAFESLSILLYLSTFVSVNNTTPVFLANLLPNQALPQ